MDDNWFDGVIEIIAATTSREQNGNQDENKFFKTMIQEDDRTSKVVSDTESTTFTGRGFYDTDIILTEAKNSSKQVILGSGVLLQDPSTWGRFDESIIFFSNLLFLIS